MNAYPELLNRMMDAILARDMTDAAAFYPDKPQFPADAQLAVYVEGYRLRLAEVIESVYPATLHYLGNGKFAALVQGFIETTPSRYFNIDRYAMGFTAYVAQRSNDLFARELAQVESTIHEVYYAEESPALSKEWLALQTPDSLGKLALMPRVASRPLAFTFPVNEYVNALRENAAPVKPAPLSQYLLVFRHNNQVRRFALEEAEYQLLSVLNEGKPLDVALEDRRLAVSETDFTRWFARWVTEGCLRQPDA